MLTMFREGLEKYHELGPPKLKCFPLTSKEMQFNLSFHAQEGNQELQDFQSSQQIEDCLLQKFTENDPTILKHLPPYPPKTLLICECGDYCESLWQSYTSVNVAEEERVKDLNSLKLKIMEGGLEVSYRCVRIAKKVKI